MARGETKPNKRSPQATDVIAGRSLRLLRGLRGLSQEQLGDAVGLTFQQIQKYENAKNRMPLSRVHEFACILNVDLGAFLKNTDVVGIELFNYSALNEWLLLFARAHEADLLSEVSALASRLLDDCESVRRSVLC